MNRLFTDLLKTGLSMDALQREMDILMDRYPILIPCRADIAAAGKRIIETLEAGGQLFLCGNGGSAADAEHMAGELLKAFVLPRPLNGDLQKRFTEVYDEAGQYLAESLQGALRVICLNGHPSFSSAMANDTAADLVFAQQLIAWGNPGDVLLGFSTSGNSTNICHACRVANVREMHSIGLTGRRGGTLRELCDILIRVPDDETHRIQELHLPIYHSLCLGIEGYFFGSATE